MPLTGLDPNVFAHVVTAVAQVLTPRRGRPWSLPLPLPLRVLIVCVALRTNLTERALAAVFNTSQSSIDRTVRHLTPILAGLFQPPRPDRRRTWVVDGTLIPVHDQTRTACSKNYRRSVNVQVVVRASDRTVVEVGRAWPGNRNDIVVARATLGPVLAEAPRRVLADGAYRALPAVITPPRGPDGKTKPGRTTRAHRRRRAVVEHVLARLKDWQLHRQCRRRHNGIDETFCAVAYLYNLRRQELRVNS